MAHKPGPLRPTVVKPSAAGARGKKTAPPASSSAVAQPTAIDGVRPERIEVHVDELRALSADASEPVCDEAARLLQALTVAMLSQRRAERWGQEVQRACQDGFSGGSVAPVSAPFIEQARADLARMTGILEAIDLKAVCAHAQGGLLAGLAKSVNRKIDTPAKLAGALDELRSLLQRMHAGVGRLLALQDGLRQRAGAFERRQVEVEAAALAALFLSNRLAGSSPTLAQRFAERHMSLGATLAQTRQGDGAYRTHVAQPLQLIGAIQGVALVKVQGLVTEMASLQALAKAGRAFPAEALNMSYRLRDILQQLKN